MLPLEAAVWSIARHSAMARRASRSPAKTGKLAVNTALRAYVEERLAGSVVAPSGALVAEQPCPERPST